MECQVSYESVDSTAMRGRQHTSQTPVDFSTRKNVKHSLGAAPTSASAQRRSQSHALTHLKGNQNKAPKMSPPLVVPTAHVASSASASASASASGSHSSSSSSSASSCKSSSQTSSSAFSSINFEEDDHVEFSDF